MVELQALSRFDKLDASWSGRAIYHNPQSRFTVPDAQLHARARQYIEEGQGFTLYLGHSNARGLWGGGTRYLDREDWANLAIKRGAGVFATFGCNGCQLGGPDGEGYGVVAARSPGGPVAVLGSHGICYAAMVQLAADGLFRSGFTNTLPERLGEAWLGLKAGLAKGQIDTLTYNLLDAVDGDRKVSQATQRQEHLEMFILLGDPALRLAQLTVDIKLEVTGDAAPGQTITVVGHVPDRLAGAKVHLTLERPVSSEPTGLRPLPQNPGEARERALLANHERANRFALLTKEVRVQDGRFQERLELPDPVPWPRLILRAYAATDRQEGLGVLVLTLAVPSKSEQH
jgi:hypothetical protein